MEDYYVNQAGTGYGFYAGSRYQRGHNWFGRIFKSGILPLIKYVGKKALKTGSNVIRDVSMGDDLKSSAKKHIKSVLHDVTDDVVDRVTQKGSGKRKRKSSKKPKPRKRRKTSSKKPKLQKDKKRKVRRRRRKLSKKILPWE